MTPPASPPAHAVAFVLLPDFSHLGLAAAQEPLFVANWLTGRALFRWSVLSLDGLSVRSSAGSHVPVEAPLGDPALFQTVIVAASFNARAHAADQRLLQWLRRAARFGVTLGAIEMGSEVLAAAGLLDGHPAAVHGYNLDGFRQQYPRVTAAAQPYSVGRGRMTCGGGTASLAMMLHWLAGQAGPELAAEVAWHLTGDPGRPPDRAAPPVSTAQAVVRAALALMRETVEQPLSCAELAARLGLSDRQLQRHVRAVQGVSLARQNLLIRLERAHQYVQQTDLSVTEIAMACGFGSPEHFSRVYHRSFGAPPRLDRHQSKSASVFRKGVL